MTHTRRPRFYLGEWIEKAGLTLEEVAARAGLSKTHVAQLKTGKRRWNEGVVVALAEALRLRNALDLFRHPDEVGELEAIYDRIPEAMRDVAKRTLQSFAEPARSDLDGGAAPPPKPRPRK